jgi:hypothetical protein
LYGVPRAATFRATDATHPYALERDVFVAALTGHRSASTLMRDVADERCRRRPRLDA